MNGQTRADNNGHVRWDERTDNTPLKGVSVRCPVWSSVRPIRQQIQESREALKAMLRGEPSCVCLETPSNGTTNGQFGGGHALEQRTTDEASWLKH